MGIPVNVNFWKDVLQPCNASFHCMHIGSQKVIRLLEKDFCCICLWKHCLYLHELLRQRLHSERLASRFGYTKACGCS